MPTSTRGSRSTRRSHRRRTRSSSPPISNDIEYIAKGSYGCVIRPALPNRRDPDEPWKQYPKNVTKLFFHKSNLNKSVKNSNHIYNLFENAGHRTHTYKHKYYASNIPNTIRRKCEKIPRNSKLYPLRLPDLGRDFYDIRKTYKTYRSIHVRTILDQILKVMKQIQILVHKDLIHGDVRETNLMISNDGIITLIDFDYLYPSAEFFEVAHHGFYSHPPETFLYEKIKFFLNASPEDVEREFNSYEMNKRMEKYIRHHAAFTYGAKINRNVTMDSLRSALCDSIFYFTTMFDVEDTNKNIQAELRTKLLPVFDGYGFAFTILEFIAYTYPSAVEPVQTPELDAALASRLTHDGEPYTPAEITAIRETLHKLVFEVLAPMADLRIQRRIPIDEAVHRVEVLLADFIKP